MSQYRYYAKRVAYFDLFSFTFQFWLAVAIFSGAMSNTNVEDRLQKLSDLGLMTNPTNWNLCVVFAIFVAIPLQLWSAIRLKEATDIDREPVAALRLACTSAVIILVVFIIDIISLFALGWIIGIIAAIHLLVRFFMMNYIVLPYIKELDMIIDSVPISATVQK